MHNARVLLVDDNDAVRTTLKQVLELHGFEVVAASGVNEALAHIGSSANFDILLSDLHMPGLGDGLTVVSAMRHANPQAVTLVFSGYPEMQAATNAILLQTDEILVKPLSIPSLIELMNQKLGSPTQLAARVSESVATILESDSAQITEEWLSRVKSNPDLMRIPLSDAERTGHLPQLIRDLILRLRQSRTVNPEYVNSTSGQEHGRSRRKQGYSAPLIVEESRMLQVSIFHVLQNNLFRVDFSLVLVDVMTIADEVDEQLCQAMQAFTAELPPAVAA